MRKYPGREGWLTGGFAGGEVGLKTYVEVGDVPIAGERSIEGSILGGTHVERLLSAMLAQHFCAAHTPSQQALRP